MKRILVMIAAFVLTIAAGAQTLNVNVGNVTYKFPSSQTGDMTYSDGNTLTIINKEFSLDEIDGMTVDYTSVTDNTVEIGYNGSTATITVAGNVAQYLTITQEGAHISIAQSDDLAQEITYTLSDIVGVSAHLCSEQLRDFNDVTFQMLPKALGVAERAWNTTSPGDFNRFYSIIVEREMPVWQQNNYKFKKRY